MKFLTSLTIGATLLSGAALADTVESNAPTAELFFAFDSSRLDEGTADTLAPIVEYAKAHPDKKIVLDGHTDPIGATTYNVKLSMRRAEIVRDRLARAGVADNQIVLGVYGENGLRRSSHAMDRRVTIWTSEQPIREIVDHTLAARGTATIWTKPVDATALLHVQSTQVSIR